MRATWATQSDSEESGGERLPIQELLKDLAFEAALVLAVPACSVKARWAR